MPTVYDPSRPLFTLLNYGRTFRQVLRSAMFWVSIGFFIVCYCYSMQMSRRKRLAVKEAVTYPASLFATLFAFMLGLFTNNCYQRYQDNWNAAMTGWSRLNDLALQVFAYIPDRTTACEVMRLMHAANHLCYSDFAGRANPLDLVRRRHLLMASEVAVLQKADGPQPFALCASWALELVHGSGARDAMVLAMDTSIREWRQATTLLPLIHLTPLPLPYYRVMVLLVLAFELVVALFLVVAFDPMELLDEGSFTGEAGSLGRLLETEPASGPWGSSLLDHEAGEAGVVDDEDAALLLRARAGAFAVSFFFYVAVTIIAQAVVSASFLFLNPWGGALGGDGLSLPAEEYLLLPLTAHRKLFAAPAIVDVRPNNANQRRLDPYCSDFQPTEQADQQPIGQPHAVHHADRRTSFDEGDSDDEGRDSLVGFAGVSALSEKSTDLKRKSCARSGARQPLNSALPAPEPLPPSASRGAAGSAAPVGTARVVRLMPPPGPGAGSIFLEPFNSADLEMLKKWGKGSESAKAKEIVAKTFRKLSTLGDSSIRPSYARLILEEGAD